ncbi:restriction endonuclease PLD domain-containing protein [Chryseolinea lacunae]|uniref:Uncharacterized protein n=1 Tax=Chryseolinea lacunae TaxID=2801331 RepID=A0ABS1KLK7_9BACT|nr:restriction endonuclease PLD domain-containing protein [Chryseolinea lacunae]MBL0740358.1 hypothetical protein [Chryseolinea lacunae]
MLVKKLAAPLINEKILVQAERAFIGTAAVSEPAFDFVIGRLPVKCKVELVTGLDVLTSPAVLRRTWAHFSDRIEARIYSRNTFHANVYIFDLPFRKSVAFIGSGAFTLEGLKDQEEAFYKITDAKEIENLKSWFVGYFEFAEPLTEAIIDEYERVYPMMKQREIANRRDKKQFMDLTTYGFQWEGIRFKLQYFKKDDFMVLSSASALHDTTELRAQRESVLSKLLQLHESVKAHVATLKIQDDDAPQAVSSLDPHQHSDQRLRTLWLCYGSGSSVERLQLQLVLRQRDFGIWLVSEPLTPGVEVRRYLHDQLKDPLFRANFFKQLVALGAGHWIEVAGDVRHVDTFPNEDALWEFTRGDDGRYFTFRVGKNFGPGDADLSAEQITVTIRKEFDGLMRIHRLMEDAMA